jgi:hypothetical protein
MITGKKALLGGNGISIKSLSIKNPYSAELGA